ncbi:MAG: ATP-grasp domain-containing protein [Granulosicoccus sp.]
MSSNRESRTVLLTLGRLPVALELARALHSVGWRVLVADPYAWHLCRLSNTVHGSFKVTAPAADEQRYLQELEKIIADEQVSLVIPVSEETLFVSTLKTRVHDSVEVLCMHQDSLLQLHDKYRFARFAKELGLSVPVTVLADDIPAREALMSRPFVVKPRLSCSGTGVRFGVAGDAFASSENNDRHIVQQRLSGEACCSFSIAAAGITLTSVCYRSLLEAGSVSICFEQMPVPEGITRFIDTVVRETRYTGMIAFDFIENDKGIWCAIECNPRSTSGIHFINHKNLTSSLIDKVACVPDHLTGRRQEFWSCLKQVQGALFKRQINRPGWKNLFRTRDITLQRSDLKPFVLMTFIMAPQLFRSLRSGIPLSEVLMSDVGWHEHSR